MRKIITDDAATVQAEILAAIRKSAPKASWPSVALRRTFGQLLERTDVLRAEQVTKEQKQREATARRKAAKQELARQKRMKQMVQSPQKWLREADKLVEARGTKNYNAAAEVLADLRDALGEEEGERISCMYTAHLAMQYPTLTHLNSSLRKQGLLPN